MSCAAAGGGGTCRRAGIGGRVENGLAATGIARPALERGMLGVDQPAPQRGILGREKGRQRDLRKQRVGVKRVAIGQGQLHRLDDRMNRVRAVVSHRLQVDVLEDLQGLEQVRALGPGPALVDGQAVISDRDRLLDPRRVGGQVDVADQTSVGARPGVDAASDRSAVKRVGHQPQPPRAVAGRQGRAAGMGLSLGINQYFERPRKSACQAAGLAGRRNRA